MRTATANGGIVQAVPAVIKRKITVANIGIPAMYAAKSFRQTNVAATRTRRTTGGVKSAIHATKVRQVVRIIGFATISGFATP